MNNTVLKIVAALLAIGAVVVAIIGVRMSRQPPAPPIVTVAEPASAPTEAVVVAAKTIKAGKLIGPGDVIIKNVASPSAQIYRQTQDLVGKIALTDLPPGTPLQASQFMADTMATLIHQGERAVAVLVDEVIGLGGFAKPGDHVDVLAYIPPNREANTRAFAQVTVHNARVLAFGEASQLDADHAKKVEPATSDDDATKKGNSARQELKEFRATLHSALLAIPEADAPRLMLAASTGLLRLSLRPGGVLTAGDAPPNQTAEQRRPQDLGPPRYSTTMTDLAPPNAPARSDEADDIIIQEGSNERRLTAKEGNSPP